MKILYVEDNDDNVYMLKNRLTRAGFTVIVATYGGQGVVMAASEQPDLILMDLTLPGIDGEEATRRIKGDPATKHIHLPQSHGDRRSRPRAELTSRSDYFSTVRMPAGPPGTLIWPVTLSDLPSKLSTSSALSSMDCASSVLPSLLQITP
jgi:DNA-binding NtrC family response regulator